MSFIEIVGVVAGSLTTISFLPQAIKTWKEKSAKDISLVMFLMFSTGIALWIYYAIEINNWILTLFNVITLVLALTILYFKLKYK